MAYPKPLSQKTIDKMFSTWDKQTVETLHTYYKAFSDLYGIIQLKDAWKIFKKFNPKIHKKEFLEFSEIVKRENVQYYIIEEDELFSDGRAIDTNRFIILKDLIGKNCICKYFWAIEIYEMQLGKPFYDRPDLLEVAADPLYKEKLLPFIENLTFYDGENKGKKFSEASFLTHFERSDYEYYKSEKRKAQILKKADIPFSIKFFNYIVEQVNGKGDPIEFSLYYLQQNNYQFENEELFNKFIELMQEFINNSHLWVNRGYTPEQLFKEQKASLPPTISFGENMKKAFAEGKMNKQEIIDQLNDMGITVIDD